MVLGGGGRVLLVAPGWHPDSGQGMAAAEDTRALGSPWQLQQEPGVTGTGALGHVHTQHIPGNSLLDGPGPDLVPCFAPSATTVGSK